MTKEKRKQTPRRLIRPVHLWIFVGILALINAFLFGYIAGYELNDDGVEIYVETQFAKQIAEQTKNPTNIIYATENAVKTDIANIEATQIAIVGDQPNE